MNLRLNFLGIYEDTHESKSTSFQNWWNDETLEKFQNLTQCFVDQYNEYDFKVFDLLDDYKGPRATNGSTTLNENIAGMNLL